MSAFKSNMPGGTRLVALIALAITACLFAWRANSFLTDQDAQRVAHTPDQLNLARMVEPVLGRDNFRIAHHVREDGTQSFLLLVHAGDEKFHIPPETKARIETILEASAGYDSATDKLQIQPIVFAPGMASGFSTAELIELGGFLVLAVLIGSLLFDRRAVALPQQPELKREPINQPQMLRAMPLSETAANEDLSAEAQRIARENPRETARILRSWMSAGGDKA